MTSKREICFLDAYTLSPGDLDLSDLDQLGHLTKYDRTSPSDIVERAKNAEIVITNKCNLNEEIISQLPHLKLIQVAATGYNNIDLNAAQKADVTVCNVSGYSTESVAQHVFALLLNYTNRVDLYHKEVRLQKWSETPDFSYWHNPIPALQSKTFGIIGYGQIGQAVAKIASAFGMRVLVSHKYDAKSTDSNITFHDQDYVFENANVISLHAPLNDSTNAFINSDSLKHMSSDTILINTGRGGLINERDLADALNDGVIQAALLDVLSAEPPLNDNPLINATNCYITPHQAWSNIRARQQLLAGIVNNIINFF